MTLLATSHHGDTVLFSQVSWFQLLECLIIQNLLFHNSWKNCIFRGVKQNRQEHVIYIKQLPCTSCIRNESESSKLLNNNARQLLV